jgi:curved DNA-binding protein CbpA
MAQTLLNENFTHYDVLDITPAASPQEVRASYSRMKATYNKDNIALYTLISPEEREDAMKKIEEAYLILSDPEKRREYDQHHGFLFAEEEISQAEVISIDRVPPMENIDDHESILVSPTTDFTASVDTSIKSLSQEIMSEKLPVPDIENSTPIETTYRIIEQPKFNPRFTEKKNYYPQIDPDLNKAIDEQIEWRGSFLKGIREKYHISIEELAEITKISKTYLTAIEEENFAKLPAPVYIRGFLAQISRELKLPTEKVAKAYLGRMK